MSLRWLAPGCLLIVACTSRVPATAVQPPDAGVNPPGDPMPTGGNAGSGGTPAPGDDAGAAPDLGSGPSQPHLVITNVSPMRLHVGDVLTLSGSGFEQPVANNLASIDTSNVDPSAFDASRSDEHTLVLRVPNVSSLSGDGQMVTLRISNAYGFAQVSFFLMPPIPLHPSGNLIVHLSRWLADSPITAGGSATAVFNVRALTSKRATYDLTAHTSVAGGEAVALDGAGQPTTTIALDPIKLADAGVDIPVRLQLPEAAVGAGSLSLALVATDNGALVGLSGTEAFTIGQAPPPPSTVSFTLSALKPAPAHFAADGIHVTAGTLTIVPLWLVPPPSGAASSWDVTGPTVDDDAADWQVACPSGTTLGPGSLGTPPVTLTVQASAGAMPTLLRLHVQAEGGGSDFADIVLPVTAD